MADSSSSIDYNQFKDRVDDDVMIDSNVSSVSQNYMKQLKSSLSNYFTATEVLKASSVISELFDNTELTILGDGYFGDVVKVKFTATKANFKIFSEFAALKLIQNIDDDSLQESLNEIEMLQTLNHPNILKYLTSYHDQMENTINLFIFTEYIEGMSLLIVIHNNLSGKSLDNISVRSMTWMYQLLDALRYIHSKNIIHKDIHAGNIMVMIKDEERSEDFIKIVDFGLSRSVKVECEYDSKVDIWNAGCVLFELVLSFESISLNHTREELCDRILDSYFHSLHDHGLDHHKKLVRRMLSEPTYRPSASELLNIIQGQEGLNNTFVGRREILDFIYSQSRKSQGLRAALVGDGGIGKSHIASKFALDYKRMYQETYWLNAENKRILFESYRKFLKYLHTYISIEKLSDYEVFNEVKKHISKFERCLLIYDNVKNLSSIFEYVIDVPKSDLLFTSRDLNGWPDHYKVIEVGPFGKEEIRLFLHRQNVWQDISVSERCEVFVSNGVLSPLTLSTSMSIIKQQNMSVDQYTTFITIYKTNDNTGINISVLSRIVSKIIEGLIDNSTVYRKIVGVFSVVDCRSIPINLFKSLFDDDDKRVLATFMQLELSSLIHLRMDVSKEYFADIHEDIQHCIKMNDNISEYEALKGALQLLNGQVSFSHDAKKRIDESSNYLIHLEAAVNNFKMSNVVEEQTSILLLSLALTLGQYYIDRNAFTESAMILSNIEDIIESLSNENRQIYKAFNLTITASMHSEKGENLKAISMYEESLRIRESIHCRNHPDVAASLNNIALVYDRQGEYSKALSMYEEALTILESLYDRTDPDIAITLNNIATVYHYQGEYNKALPMYQESLRITESIYGRNHPDVAISLHNLAGFYESQGEYDKSLSMYQESLNITEAIYGRNHPAVATSLNSIALVYYSQREYSKALSMYEESLGIYESIYGRNHPDVASSLNNIALVYDDLGEYSKALSMYEESLKITESIYGRNHPNVAKYLNNIARVYDSQGEYSKALSMFEESLRIKETIYGRNHRFVAIAFNNIGSVYESQGEYKQSVAMYQMSLNIFESIYGRNHPDVAVSLQGIAFVYKTQGEYSKALSLYEESLRIYESIYGRNHPDVAESLDNMASLYDSEGDYKKALVMYKKSLRIRESIYDRNHPDVAASLDKVASVYDSQGEYGKALSMYQKSLKIYELANGRNHPAVATSLNNIALVYESQGEYSNALSMYEESLRIRESIYGRNHPDVAESLENVASVYDSQGEYGKALSMYEKSLKIYELANGRNHPDVATSLINIASVYESQGEYSKALSMYEESLRIRESIHGRNHPAVAECLDNIAAIKELSTGY